MKPEDVETLEDAFQMVDEALLKMERERIGDPDGEWWGVSLEGGGFVHYPTAKAWEAWLDEAMARKKVST